MVDHDHPSFFYLPSCSDFDPVSYTYQDAFASLDDAFHYIELEQLPLDYIVVVVGMYILDMAVVVVVHASLDCNGLVVAAVVAVTVVVE